MTVESRPAPAWIGLLILFTFGSFIEAIMFGHLSAFTPLYLPKLGIAPADVPSWTGMIAAIAGIPGLLFLPLWGALADKFARKPIIIRSFVVEVLLACTVALAGNIWVFIIGRALSGLALGNSGLMLTTLAERAPDNRRAVAFAIMNTAGPIGVFLGPLMGGAIMDRWGFNTLLWVDAALMVFVVLSLSLAYKDTFKSRDDRPLLNMAVESIQIIWNSQSLRSLFPALFMLFAGSRLAMTYVPIAIDKLYSGPNEATTVGLVLGAGGLVSIFLGPAFGLLGDRFGLWRLLFVGVGLQILIWPLLALMPGLLAFAITYALVNGIGSGVFAISFSVLSNSTTDNVRGRVMSFAFLPSNIALIVGPAIGAAVTRQSVFAAFPVAGLLTMLGLGMMIFAFRKQAPGVR